MNNQNGGYGRGRGAQGVGRRFTLGFPFGDDFFTNVFANDAWKDFDQIFSAFSGTIQPFPPYNVYALKEGSVRIDLALAGYDEDKITLRADDGKLIIEGKGSKDDCECLEGEECSCEDDCKCVYHGIRSSDFRTTIPVAAKFDLSKADPQMKNGMLSITIPVAEERKPKVIKIQFDKKKELPADTE